MYSIYIHIYDFCKRKFAKFRTPHNRARRVVNVFLKMYIITIHFCNFQTHLFFKIQNRKKWCFFFCSVIFVYNVLNVVLFWFVLISFYASFNFWFLSWWNEVQYMDTLLIYFASGGGVLIEFPWNRLGMVFVY